MNNLENEISNCLKDSASNLSPSYDLKVKVFSKLACPKIKKHKFINKNLFIELLEVAVFIFVIIAVPISVSHNKSISNKSIITTNKQQNNTNPVIAASTTNNSSNNIVIQEDIQSRHFKGKLLVISNPMKVKLGYNKSNPTIYKTTSELAKENNALCAINAGAFKAATPESTGNTYGMPAGIIFHEGNLVYSDLKNNEKCSIVGLDINGKLIIGDFTLDELKQLQVKEAVSKVGPSLIINGKLSDVSNGYGVNARTAIGQKDDGSIIFLVIDGRSDTSIGAKLNEIQKILFDNGAVTAANLDGGSSSTIFYQGSILNTPCDKTGERPVTSAFIVIP